MIFWDKKKNKKLIKERGISFYEISQIIQKEEFIEILENPSRKNQFIFIVDIRNYIYSVPFIFDEDDNIVLKTAYPSRKFNKIYGDQND